MSSKNWAGPTFNTNRAQRRAEEKAARKRQNGLKQMQRQMREAAEARKAAAAEAERRAHLAEIDAQYPSIRGAAVEGAWVDEAAAE